jgi:hypothetical protein
MALALLLRLALVVGCARHAAAATLATLFPADDVSGVKTNGVFVDVGAGWETDDAAAAAAFSYTHGLEVNFDWRGLCFEWDAESFTALAVSRPRCVCVNALPMHVAPSRADLTVRTRSYDAATAANADLAEDRVPARWPGTQLQLELKYAGISHVDLLVVQVRRLPAALRQLYSTEAVAALEAAGQPVTAEAVRQVVTSSWVDVVLRSAGNASIDVVVVDDADKAAVSVLDEQSPPPPPPPPPPLPTVAAVDRLMLARGFVTQGSWQREINGVVAPMRVYRALKRPNWDLEPASVSADRCCRRPLAAAAAAASCAGECGGGGGGGVSSAATMARPDVLTTPAASDVGSSATRCRVGGSVSRPSVGSPRAGADVCTWPREYRPLVDDEWLDRRILDVWIPAARTAVAVYANNRNDTVFGTSMWQGHVRARRLYVDMWDTVVNERWEMAMLQLLPALIKQRGTAGTVYVDIGAWIGPTVLLAAQFADRVVAVEADPRALSELRANVLLNDGKPHTVGPGGRLRKRVIDEAGDDVARGIGSSATATSRNAAPYEFVGEDLAARVELLYHCIAPAGAAGETEMRGAVPLGSSTSYARTLRLGGEEDVSDPTGKRYTWQHVSWHVQCSSLPHVLGSLVPAVAARDVSVLKIDIEGAEALVLPDLLPWLLSASPDPKPTILVELHPQYWFNRSTQTPAADTAESDISAAADSESVRRTNRAQTEQAAAQRTNDALLLVLASYRHVYVNPSVRSDEYKGAAEAFSEVDVLQLIVERAYVCVYFCTVLLSDEPLLSLLESL